MANEQHVSLLHKGTAKWNRWRESHARVRADLREADLEGCDLRGASLFGADLSGAHLREADLRHAILTNARLIGADFENANLTRVTLNWADASTAIFSNADLSKADLRSTYFCKSRMSGVVLQGARMTWADLENANLARADIRSADLSKARLVRTNFNGADLTGCRVYGCSVWDVKVSGAIQQDLIITPGRAETVTVDDLKVAQFVYLLLNNPQIRDVIDEVTSKVVLILGRFSDERKPILDAIREDLRSRNLAPVLFDFAKPASKDLTGTVETLARMARFIIADLTDYGSIPHELATIVPFLRTTPVLPLRLASSRGYSMFKDLQAYSWVLPTHEYSDAKRLISELGHVIAPADKKARDLRSTKARSQ